MDQTTESRLALDILLKEHEFLSADLGSRVDRQSQAFNLVVVVVGVTVTGVGALFGNSTSWQKSEAMPFLLTLEICVLLSASMCMTAPLALLFFDDELMIFAVIAYIQEDWNLALRDLAKTAESVIAPRRFFQADFCWKDEKVKVVGKYNHGTVARARWWLFNLPFIAATATLAGTVAWGWNNWRSLLHAPFTATTAVATAAVILYILGCIAYLRMARAWHAAKNMREHCCQVR